MRAKSRDLANVQNARRIADLSPAPWALAWSSGKLGRFPAGHSLLFPLEALHPRFPTKQTHLQSRVKSGHSPDSSETKLWLKYTDLEIKSPRGSTLQWNADPQPPQAEQLCKLLAALGRGLG
ncbi:hypothetical protein VULLAG_LOCUS6230 [Vulpes lagopus]